jgi:hypothetical protein
MGRQRRADSPAEPEIVIPELPDPVEMAQGAVPDDNEDEDDFDVGDLIALTDQQFADVVWYIWRQMMPGEVPPPGRKFHPRAPTYVGLVRGSLDLEAIKEQVGGGTFRVRGLRGKRTVKNFCLNIDAPPKRFAVDGVLSAPAFTAQPAVMSAAAAPVNREVLELLQKVAAQLEKLSAPPAGLGLADLLTIVKVLPSLAPQQSLGGDVLKEAMGLFREGLSVGRTVEGGEGADKWALAIEKLAPLAERVIVGMAARRGAARGATAPPASSPAGAPVEARAEVVEPLSESTLRMGAVIDALARTIAANGDPAMFADYLEVQLPPLELAPLRAEGVTAERVIADLEANGAITKYPILHSASAHAFIDAVLVQLRTEPDDTDADE